MRFGNFNVFSRYVSNQPMAGGGSDKTDTAASSDASKHYQNKSQLKNLLPGQTITGEIVAIDGNEVQIAVGKDQYITAKLERGMQIALGQSLTFEVKGNNGSQVSLRPLFENLSQNPNLEKAIQASNIPLNNNTMAMVSKLMDEGMPIDKQSLQNMHKMILDNPKTDMSTLMQMGKLQIPITEENLAQFASYKNLEHQIVKGVETIINSISETLLQMVQTGDGDAAAQLYGKLVEIFTAGMSQTDGQNAEALLSNILQGSADGEGQLQTGAQTLPEGTQPSNDAQQLGQQATGKAQMLQTEMLLIQEAEILQGQGTKGGQIAKNGMQAEVLISQNEITAVINGEKGSETAQKGDVAQTNINGIVTGSAKGEVGHLLSNEARLQLSQLLLQAGASEHIIAGVQNGSASAKEVLEAIRQILMQSGSGQSEAAKQILCSKELSGLLKSAITKQWLLEPKDLLKEGNIEELYSKMREQTQKLTEALVQAGKAEAPVTKFVQNMQSSVEFMNQLNHTYTYVQLPLKLKGQNAHGDLYVYTNKKNLAKKDGNVSALLHLEMEHLGTVDVYVAMQQAKVNTKFYLQDEKMLDFIYDNIHILTERLEKRGYQANCEVTLKESDKKTPVIDEILQENKNSMMIGKYSFDVRA